ncbi:MAG: hypothetical protein CSA47_01875 [Gammaproteobacteria bacterium]|nr:MAG: hypothetical protein CSA47_01875 [Gammaproteobacteria bacterium]
MRYLLKGLWSLGLLSFLTLLSAGDENIIKTIRKRYQSVNQLIEQCNNVPEETAFHEVCPIYHDLLLSNDRGGQFCGPGNHQVVTDLWYDHSVDCNGMGVDKLIKVYQKETIAAATYNYEYVYDEAGKLIFYFQKGGYEQREIRFYFNQGKLIKSIISDPPKGVYAEEVTVTPEAVLKEAKKLYNHLLL